MINPAPPNAPGIQQELDPQLTGIIDDMDRERINADEKTIFAEALDGSGAVPLLTPVLNNSEMNPDFFGRESDYYMDLAQTRLHALDIEPVSAIVARMPSGTRISLDYRGDREADTEEFFSLVASAGREASLDPSCVDERNDTLASVHHYFAPIEREEDLEVGYETLVQSQEAMKIDGSWEKYENSGVKYVSGPDINEGLLEKLWDVYDKTFDELVQNHPAAQKQPKTAFFEQTKLESSSVFYAEDSDGEISSALFIVDVKDCNWLNQDFYSQLSPEGTTLFVPALSTKLDKRGAAYSHKLIKAMAEVVSRVESVTAYASQCTNISSEYIPMITERYTKGTINLRPVETAIYRYPVFVLD